MGAPRRRGRAQALTAARAQIIVAQHSPPPSRSDDANPSRRVARLYPALSAAERRVSCWPPPTADMLVQEVLSRNMRDRRAIAHYAGLTGSPDESGTKRREKGLARSGNARVRRGMIQLAWRFLMFQKDSALAQWFRARTENARGTRKTMIVALARKLLIALWRLVREGVVPDGVVLRPAQ